MDHTPEIDISEEQANAIARGLLTVARTDGGLDARELELINEFAPGDASKLPDIAPDELARAIGGTSLAPLFLKSCFLVALADGDYSAQERDVIDRYGAALGVSGDALESLGQSVKEYLLKPLSRLANSQAVADVSKKLQV
jgi:tellurite resistance protein